jgi:eukaryotic-like serine/threonine-protein kinase
VRGRKAPASRAPKQEGGLHSRVDNRADLTAPISALVMLAHRTSTALASFRHDVPPDLEDLVLRLLAKHPGERHADATSVDSFLDPSMDITQPFRFPASPRPPATRVGTRAQRRR